MEKGKKEDGVGEQEKFIKAVKEGNGHIDVHGEE